MIEACYAVEMALPCHATGNTLQQLNGTLTTGEALGTLTKIVCEGPRGVIFTTEGTAPTATIDTPGASPYAYHINKQVISLSPAIYPFQWKFTFSIAGEITMYYTNWQITD